MTKNEPLTGFVGVILLGKCQRSEFRISFGLYIIDEPAVPVDTMLDRAAHAQRSIKGNSHL